jgi:uncharacterized membrane protein YcaP (DUF421 family)
METVIRIAVIYIFLMIGLRVLGKRELSEMSPFDFLVLLLIPEIVSQGMIGEDFSITNGLVGVATLFTLVFLTSLLNYHSKVFRKATEGTPVVLVRRGQLVQENMDAERVPSDEIFSEMHKAGLELLSQVKWAILESDGKISIVTTDPGEARQVDEHAKL